MPFLIGLLRVPALRDIADHNLDGGGTLPRDGNSQTLHVFVRTVETNHQML